MYNFISFNMISSIILQIVCQPGLWSQMFVQYVEINSWSLSTRKVWSRTHTNLTVNMFFMNFALEAGASWGRNKLVPIVKRKSTWRRCFVIRILFCNVLSSVTIMFDINLFSIFTLNCDIDGNDLTCYTAICWIG